MEENRVQPLQQITMQRRRKRRLVNVCQTQLWTVMLMYLACTVGKNFATPSRKAGCSVLLVRIGRMRPVVELTIMRTTFVKSVCKWVTLLVHQFGVVTR